MIQEVYLNVDSYIYTYLHNGKDYTINKELQAGWYDVEDVDGELVFTHKLRSDKQQVDYESKCYQALKSLVVDEKFILEHNLTTWEGVIRCAEATRLALIATAEKLASNNDGGDSA